MKIKHQLDVDFIGSQEPLTKEEEVSLSEFFKKRKSLIKGETKIKKRARQSKNKETV